MLAEDRRLLELALESVKKNRKEVEGLQHELQMFLIKPNDNLSVIDAEEQYRNALCKLQREKRRRINMVDDFCSQLALLSSQMGEPENIPTFDHVPAVCEIETLEQLVNSKRQLFEMRTSCYLSLASEIRSLAMSMNYKGKDTFERFAIECKDIPPVLSSEELEKMSHFLKELKVKHDLFLEELKKMCALKLSEIATLWEKCKIDLNRQQSFRKSIEDFNLLKKDEMLEAEIKLLRNYYEERREVFAKFEQWEQTWSVKLELERHCKDASRFSNRGGVLLQEEKVKKATDRKLARARREVQEAVNEWNTSNPGDPITVYGTSPVAAIEAVEANYAHEREKERVERKLARQAQLESEATFGSQNALPTLRSIPNLRAPLSQKNEAPRNHNLYSAVKEERRMVLIPTNSNRIFMYEGNAQHSLSLLQEDSISGSSIGDMAKSSSSSGYSA
ncbi:MAP65 ASE1 domain containing protein [Trichuris trichiura]|uniref:MAP65 ASE1 domain containing protein n=1 Tax=Trichuris trichiura TaxID=36087 RepID=A0A077ZL06_TRITR|nr:MAP65 ASE1 domain containing protein [Trichuris trichiura]